MTQARDEERRLEAGLRDRTDGRESIADLRSAMQEVMEDSAGIFRTQAFLSKGADALRELQERSASLAIEDHSREFNTQVVAALELSYMLDVAEAIIACALRREESRGAPATRPPGAGRRPLPRPLAHPPRLRGSPPGRVPPGRPHPMAPGGEGLREMTAHG